MGTISDKLTYLNTTKTMLKDSLNKFGSSILSTDTFRSYDTKLNEIYDKLPKVTATGQGLTISNVQNGLLDDFKMNGVDLEQDTTTGKNLLNISDITSGNGIKNNNNKSITLNGNITSTSFTLTNPITLKANATYIMSLTNNDTNAGDSTFILRNGNTNKMSIYFKNLVSNAPFTPTEDIIIDTLRIYNSGVTFNNYTFSIQLEEGSSSTSFEPYTGGIASPNPEYPQDIKVVEGRQVITDKGKNLFKPYINNSSITINDVECNIDNNDTITLNGTASQTTYIEILSNFAGVTSRSSTKYITLDESKIYILKSSILSGTYTNSPKFNTQYDNQYSEKGDTFGNSISISNSDGLYRAWLRVENGTVFNNLKIKIQIEEGTTATNYEPYYNPVSYNIDLNLENIYLAKIPNTDYKNRIYKNNGNWYYEESVKKIVLDGSEDYYEYSINENIIRFQPIILNDLAIPLSQYVSNNFKYLGAIAEATETGISNGVSTTNSRCFIFILKSIASNTANFKTWLSTHNTEVWYILETPVTTQITNTTLISQLETISTFKGTNIFTITNDNNIIPEIEITRLKELEKLA